jgi:hypothetical protein
MPDEAAAVVEAPVVETAVDETVDTGAQDGAGEAGGNEGSGAAGGKGNEGSVDGEASSLRGAELYHAVKDSLKGLDPKLSRSIRNALHMADKANRFTNGDIDGIPKAFEALRSLADDPDGGYTPEQIVQSAIEERQFWRDFDDSFAKGDTKIIDMMVTENPDSFQKLVIPAIDKFAEMNPEGYSSLVARSTKGYFDESGMPIEFSIIDTFLPSMPDFPGKQRFVEALQKIWGVYDSIGKMASKPVGPKATAGAPENRGGLDQREESIAQREMMATKRDWDGNTQKPGLDMRESEITRVATQQKVTLTDADKQKIRDGVREELNARLAADSRYGQAMRGYLQAGNRKAYADRALSEYKKLIPGITRRHAQAVIDEKKAKPAVRQPNAARPAAQRQTANNGGAAGGNLVQWLPGHPRTIGKVVDLNRTTNAMLQRKEAYLKGDKNLSKWK